MNHRSVKKERFRNKSVDVRLRFVSIKRKGKVIAFPSGKGGVGKTTVSVNLGAALSIRRYNVVIIDTNLTLPNLQLFLTIKPKKTLTHYLSGNATREEIIGEMELKNRTCDIIPAKSVVDYGRKIEIRRLPALINDLKTDYDFIVLDVPPGLSKYAVYPLKLSDRIFIVSTDTKPAYTDSIKVQKVSEGFEAEFGGYILNMVSREDIRYFKYDNIFATIPQSKTIDKAMKAGKTLFHSRTPSFMSPVKKAFLYMADAIAKSPKF